MLSDIVEILKRNLSVLRFVPCRSQFKINIKTWVGMCMCVRALVRINR